MESQSTYPTAPAKPGFVWMASPANDRWAQVDTSLVREGKSRGYRVVSPRPQMPQNRRWDRGMFASPGAWAGAVLPPAEMAQVSGRGLGEIGRMEVQQLPLQAAMLATMAFPGSGPPLLAALQRVTAAGGAALPASLASQAMQGQTPTVEQAQRDVLTNAGAQAGGEALAGTAGLTARGLAGLATRIPPSWAEKFPGINLAKELLARGIGSSAEATAARASSARDARRAAVESSRKRQVTFSPTSIPQQEDLLVPGVVSSTEGVNIPPSATTADLAAASSREAQARYMLHDMAAKAGYSDEEFVALLSNPSPNALDVANAFKRGLGPQELAAAREQLGALGGEASTLAEATPQQWYSTSNDVVFSPTRDMVTPREPNAIKATVGKKFQYQPKQFAESPEVQRVRNLIRKQSSQPDADMAELDAFLESWQSQQAAKKSPIQWYRQAQGLQREAKPFYGRGGAGVGQQMASSPTVQAAKAALASAIKRELSVGTPAIATHDASTQALIALERALKRNDTIVQKGGGLAGAAVADVLARRLGHAGAGEVPAAVAGAYLGHAMSSPTVLANSALALNSPYVQSVLRQSPRAALALLQSNLLANPGGSQ